MSSSITNDPSLTLSFKFKPLSSTCPTKTPTTLTPISKLKSTAKTLILTAATTLLSLKLTSPATACPPPPPTTTTTTDRLHLARLLTSTQDYTSALDIYSHILASDPLSFPALFESSVLLDRTGDGDKALQLLHQTLQTAINNNDTKKQREIRLIIAQIEYLRRNVDEALRIYEELAAEDGADFRPWFCQGVIYSLIGRDDEAKERFRKCKELCPKEFQVNGFMETPESRVPVFAVQGEGKS